MPYRVEVTYRKVKEDIYEQDKERVQVTEFNDYNEFLKFSQDMTAEVLPKQVDIVIQHFSIML